MKQVKLEINLPENVIIPMCEALHEVQAGIVGNYDHVMSYSHVKGAWRPLANAHPYDGEINQISYGEECKLELRCPYNKVAQACKIIRQIHPYEEPLINILPLLNDEFQIA